MRNGSAKSQVLISKRTTNERQWIGRSARVLANVHRVWFPAAFLLMALHGTVLAASPFSIRPTVSTNVAGGTIELSLVQNEEAPANAFGFVWSKGGMELEETDRVRGTRGPVLRIGPTEVEDEGVYSVTFTNAVPGEEEVDFERYLLTATVYVLERPQFLEEPFAESRGLDVTLRANAIGGMLSYQWFWQGQPLAGATNSSLRFTNAYANANAGYYTVQVSNPAYPEGVFASRSLLVTKPAPGGTYQGLFYDPDLLVAESSGWVQFSVSASRSTFSGSLLLGTRRYSFSGALPPEHYVEVEATAKNTSPLLLRLQLLTVNDLPQMTGEVIAEGWSSTLRAHRLHYTSKAPTTLSGSYTLALQNTNLSLIAPTGDGFGAIVTRPDGTVRVKGRAADGTAFSSSAGMSRVGDWPLHVVTHRGRGRLLGWLRTAKQSNRSIHGNWVGWVKDPGPDKNYPDGFGLVLQPTGSTYTPPSAAPVLAFTNGVAAIYGGDLVSQGDPFWTFIRMKLTPPASFRAEKSTENLQLSVNKGNGLVSGSFRNMATGKSSRIYGAVLQQQLAVRGFFQSTNSAGSFLVAPE